MPIHTKAGIGKWVEFYNTVRPHSSLMDKAPCSFYQENLQKAA
jgi:transposase InsO family protein